MTTTTIQPARTVTVAGPSGDVSIEDYREFLSHKAALAPATGFRVELDAIHPLLKPHQKLSVQWAVQGGRRAIFSSFGLGKTVTQLEVLRLTLHASGGGRGLIVVPLGVRQEFIRDAAMLGQTIRFIRRIEEADTDGMYLTNYETVRDGKLDPSEFLATSLDEAAVLRSFGGTKTFREFMRVFESVQYRFVATATPDPNEYIELLAYAAYLGIMEVGQAKTRWFKRDSTKADCLTLHPHKEREFWLWVASWALFLQKPSDIGCSDAGYDLPPLDIRWHELPSDHSRAVPERDGQGRIFKDCAAGVTEAAREKKDSMSVRMAKLMELLDESPRESALIWHDLEAERHAIEAAVPHAKAVWGSQDLDEREEIIRAFADGEIQILAAKPVMLSSGVNFQRHCARAIFLGIGFKFNEVIQAVHRIHRFLQPTPVRIDLIYTEAERSIRQSLEDKWQRYTAQTEKMAGIIREFGLADAALASELRRTMGVPREESAGPGYRMIRNDTVEECATLEADSVGLIVTSIPFASQYEYTPSMNDFGYSESNAQFWTQMGFLTPSLYRALQPGRIMAIHVKDRIVPSGMTGLGFQVVSPLHAEAITHYSAHGFGYLGMKTIVTDVVRENNQTYRLGYSEQCKDGTKMGCGMPEYLLLFRKPPTDRSNGYADVPVEKSKDAYSLGRWQIDAHGFARSSGDRLLTPEELASAPHEQIYKRWKAESMGSTYSFARHLEIVDGLRACQRLPVTFMVVPPHSWHPDVWADVMRARTLNTLQSASGREQHLCPLQFDIVERCITQHSMAGETVLDPFGGLGSVAYCALKLGRQAISVELSHLYHGEAVRYAEQAVREIQGPTLFDWLEEREQCA